MIIGEMTKDELITEYYRMREQIELLDDRIFIRHAAIAAMKTYAGTQGNEFFVAIAYALLAEIKKHENEVTSLRLPLNKRR